jgi:hypothetical protein
VVGDDAAVSKERSTIHPPLLHTLAPPRARGAEGHSLIWQMPQVQ